MTAPERTPNDLAEWAPYLTTSARVLIDRRWQKRLSESDLVQQTMLDAIRQRETFERLPLEKRSGWLLTILRRNILDAAKAQLAACRDVRREQSLENSLDGSISKLRNRDSGADDGDSRERKLMALTAAIERMPEKERTILTLRYLDRLTTREIAERTGLSVKAATLLIARTVRRLKGVLGNPGKP